MKNLDDVTILIKTFERKNMLSKLLKSIEKYYPNLPIIIVDDSKKNYKRYIMNKFSKSLNIQYIIEDYDIGLSKGRNILINNVKTKYFLLCDDDFEFDNRTKIELAKSELIKKDLDILGGIIYNRISLDSVYSILWVIKDIRRLKKVIDNEEFECAYNGKYFINNKNIKLVVESNCENYKEDKFYETEICTNFFIAKTSSIKNIGGWTPEILKVGEHEFFFLKAKENNLKIMYTPKYGVRHFPKKSFSYLKFRLRAQEYFEKACQLNKIESFEVYDKSKKCNTYEYFLDKK